VANRTKSVSRGRRSPRRASSATCCPRPWPPARCR